MHKGKHTLQELAPCVRVPGGQTQVVKPGGRNLYRLSQPALLPVLLQLHLIKNNNAYVALPGNKYFNFFCFYDDKCFKFISFFVCYLNTKLSHKQVQPRHFYLTVTPSCRILLQVWPLTGLARGVGKTFLGSTIMRLGDGGRCWGQG